MLQGEDNRDERFPTIRVGGACTARCARTPRGACSAGGLGAAVEVATTAEGACRVRRG